MQAETSVADALIGDDTVRSPNATAPIPGLVWAFHIHSDGSSESLAVDQPIEFTHDGLLWLHFNLADARALQWLASADLQAPVQARSLLLSKDTYQQLHTTDESVYGVISDLLRDIAEATEETGYLRFAMTERLLVSGRHHALCAVDATRRALEDGRRIESVAALLETIVENVADTMDRIAERIARSHGGGDAGTQPAAAGRTPSEDRGAGQQQHSGAFGAHGGADAADTGYRHFRHEHQGSAVYGSRYGVLVGVAAHGVVLVRRLPHHETHRYHQIV